MARHSPSTISRSDTNTYKDLRSRRRLRNRQAKQSAKYYGYRGVHPSWIDQPYFDFARTIQSPYWTYNHPNIYASMDPLVTGAEAKVATWTKRDMWLDREYNIWPLDRRHHVGKRIREKSCWKWNEQSIGRRTRIEHRNWELAVEDARDVARLMDDDNDTVYWELEEREWDDVEEVWN